MKLTESIEHESKDRCVLVYVPSKDIDGRKLDNLKMFDKMVNLFVRLFNGCTTYAAKGVWKTESGKLVKETIVIVEAYAPGKIFQRALIQVLSLVENLKRDYHQENMAVFLGNKLHLY